MTKDEKELISEQFLTMRAEIRADNMVIMYELKRLTDQVTLTNGRVKTLERETGIGRWFERNPKRFVLLIAAVTVLSTRWGVEFFETIWHKLF